MGVSLYFVARRAAELSDIERSVIESLVDEFAVEDQIEQYLGGDDGGINWESFSWRSQPSRDEVFTGAVRLPDLTQQMMMDGIDHWGRLLGRIRGEILHDAEWDVDVEGGELTWNPDNNRYGTTTTANGTEIEP